MSIVCVLIVLICTLVNNIILVLYINMCIIIIIICERICEKGPLSYICVFCHHLKPNLQGTVEL